MLKDYYIVGGMPEAVQTWLDTHDYDEVTEVQREILKDYGEKAQLEHSLTPHTLRNSFAVHMLQNGADLKSLQELMGHDDITATQVYLSATKSRLKDVYDRAHPRA